MMEDSTTVADEPESRSTTHIVHVLMQFAVAVRHRKNVLIGCVLGCGLLGALYYVSATPRYSSMATLLVIQSAADEGKSMVAQSSGVNQGLMPTFERLISSTEVIEAAIEKLKPEDLIDLVDVPREKRVEVLRRNLTAKIVYGTNFINIEYRSKDPGAAVNMVNALVDSYLTKMDGIHHGTASLILATLELERERISSDLEQALLELKQAKWDAGDFGGLDGDSTVRHPVVEKAFMLYKALAEAVQERAQLEELVAANRRVDSDGSRVLEGMLADADQLAANAVIYTGGVNDRDATALNTRVGLLLDDLAKLKSASPHWGPNHPGRIELENSIHTTLAHLKGYLPQKLAEARLREVSLQRECFLAKQEAEQLIGPMSEIDLFEVNVAFFQEQLQGLLVRMANVDMAQDGPGIHTEVTDEPIRALKPISPSLRRAGLMALVAGLGLGLAAVYVLDTLDDRFRSVEEMQAQLRVPVMAIVRRLPVSEQTGPQAVQVHTEPDAPTSEAFRTLRTALSLTEGPSRQIVVTSTEPGDGKTTVLVNLAAAIAQSGKRTLLVDADLRRPGLTAMLNLRGVEGLSGVVRAEGDVVATATAFVRPSGIEGLDVLPSGPRVGNPAELLVNPRFSELLAWAESVYDQVVIDSPPALAASDAALIGRLVDGVVLVVDPAKNRRRLVLRAVETFSQLKISLFGLVVNRIGADGDGGYYEYGADYQSEYVYDDEDDDWEQIGRAA